MTQRSFFFFYQFWWKIQLTNKEQKKNFSKFPNLVDKNYWKRYQVHVVYVVIVFPTRWVTVLQERPVLCEARWEAP